MALIIRLDARHEGACPCPPDRFDIQGHVSCGFEAVRKVFAENFVRRRELGGGCCACHRGEKVVDLWGGINSTHGGVKHGGLEVRTRRLADQL